MNKQTGYLNPRVLISVKPQKNSHLYLTSLGLSIIASDQKSYLQLLNTIQLVKVNTSSNQRLKLGQSFYFYFHLTDQYLAYDQKQNCLFLTRVLGERTLFKIISDSVDWKNKNNILTYNHGTKPEQFLTKYRMILAEHSSKFLCLKSQKLQVASIYNSTLQEVQNSFMYLQDSIYFCEQSRYPVRFITLQNSLTIAYQKWQIISKLKASAHSSMFLIENDQSGLYHKKAIKHIETGCYLTLVNKQLLFGKNIDGCDKFIFNIYEYDDKGQYVFLRVETQEGIRNITTKKNNHKCEIGKDNLMNLIKRQFFSNQQLQNIAPFAWLKAQFQSQYNQQNIYFIFDEIIDLLHQFYEVYQHDALRNLIQQGLLQALQQSVRKYQWNKIGLKITQAISLMLKVDSQILGELFRVQLIYINLLQTHQFEHNIHQITMNAYTNNLSLLKNAQKIILNRKQIDVETLWNIIIISNLYEQHRQKHQQTLYQLKQFIQNICQQSINQLNRKFVSAKYIASLQIILNHSCQQKKCLQVFPNLSIEVINHEKSSLKNSLDYIHIIQQFTNPFIFVATDIDDFHLKIQKRVKIFNQSIGTWMMNYVEDILPKNARFQTFESKVLSIALCRISVNFNYCSIDSFQCKKWIKLLIENIDNLKNSGYPQQKFGLFINQGLKTLKTLFQLYVYLLCQQTIKYDSITLKVQDKVNTSIKGITQIGSVNNVFGTGIWTIFVDSSSLISLYPFSDTQFMKSIIDDSSSSAQQITGNIILSFLQIGLKLAINYRSSAEYYLQNLKPLNQLTEQFQQFIVMFVNQQYKYKWTYMAKFMLETMENYTEAEFSSIITIIHKNDLYKWVCQQHNDICYRALNELAISSQKGDGGYLDGLKILEQLIGNTNQLVNNNHYQYQWIQTDCQFILLRNILYLLGGVVSEEVYQIYKDYVCNLPPNKWSISYLRLCQCFYSFIPELLKESFAITYQHIIFHKVDTQKMGLKLREEDQQFLQAYISILSMLAKYHTNKYLVYQLIGDETLFEFLQKYEKNIELKIVILSFMIETRMKKYQQTNYLLQQKEYQWFKLGTVFIRRQITQTAPKRNSQFLFLKDYTYSMVDFLKMREDALQYADFPQNQMLVIQGTNKLCAFQIADLIQSTLNLQQISRDIIDKIQWFENTFKINVNSLELTHISIDPPDLKIKPENFRYTYKLQVDQNLGEAINLVQSKFGLSNFITLLLRLLSAYTINMNQKYTDRIQVILHYLHYIVTKRSYKYIEKEIAALFMAMQQHMRHKKYKQVAILQNIIRKAICNKSKIDKLNQKILQKLVLKNKQEICDYFSNYVDRYIIFSPLYYRNNSYYTHHAEQKINWIISEYLAMIRFLLCLSKSLDLQFKSIFAQSSVFKKQLIGKIISVTEKHCQVLKDPSKIRLTLITYELDLINSLILGPQKNNISSVIKLQYPSLIINKLMVLKDYVAFQSPQQQEKHKIIIKMKQLIAETLFTLADFYSFSTNQTKIIEECLILYYLQASKFYGSSDFDKIIVSYSNKNKNTLAVRSFDLTLHLFYAIIRIYKNQQNYIIQKIKTKQLQQIRLIKSYNKRFKMFYQLYRLTVQIFAWMGNMIYKCCHNTANQMNIDEMTNFFENIGDSHEQKLTTVFKFFTRHVQNVQIQVGEQTQTVYFLLLKQAQCYNPSIRKQFHRRVGLGTRQYRLSRFMELSNHIVLRLQVQKSIKYFTQKYKPFDIIIKNRQLWKSMNFLCACLLNLLFLELGLVQDPQVPENIIRSLSYLFCIFLFIIYFIQNLPLKRKLAIIYARDTKKSKLRYVKSCLQIFNDKTLWFATIYFIILSLSFYQLGFVSLLMVDFFVRFKISKKVTQIVTRPIVNLLFIIMMSVQVAFVYTCYLYFINESIDCPDTATCIQNTYKTYLGINKNEHIPISDTDLTFRSVTTFFFAFFNIFVTTGLVVGVLLYEKKAKDIKNANWEEQFKKKCFICDTDRSEIDRSRNNNQGFFEHIQEQHNLWSYMFYLVYLKNQDEQNMNIIESMVMDEWNKKGIEWLPITFKENK